MRITLGEIARFVGGELVGESGIEITGISGIKEAVEGDITFLANPKYFPLIHTTKAAAIITSRDVVDFTKPLIKTEDPSFAFAKVVELIIPKTRSDPKGIHPTAVVSSKAILGKDVSVGAHTIIEDDALIQDGTIIYGLCYIGSKVKIGKNCLIYSNVSIRESVEIKNNVIVHCGAVIGSDGFGFTMLRGAQYKIPQIGNVVIEDDVEIGANVTIDRARFDKTVVGRGTKIDNLVHIAHNVIIGENCTIIAQAGISGSTTLGKGVILAGQAGLVGHIHIGDGAIVAAQAGVTKSVESNTKVSGYPAKPHNLAKRVNACLQRLPETYDKIKELENKIVEIETQLKQLQSKE